MFSPDGCPVSWSLIKADGSGGMTHTLEEYRGLGLSTVVHLHLTRQMLQSKYMSMGYTATDNAAALHVYYNKIGGQSLDEVVFLGYTPPLNNVSKAKL